MKLRRRTTGGRGRRGVLSMELALVLPILLAVLLGLFEFSMLFFARGSVVEASRAGARLASMPGVVPEEVEAAVREALSPRMREGLRVDLVPGEHAGDVVGVAVRVPMEAASPDLLWPIGYGLEGRELHAETRMVRE